MKRITYSQIIKNLEGFDPWLVGLGVKPVASDRIHKAFNILRRADEASRRGHETGKFTDIGPDDWFGIVEALEANDVFAAFQNDTPEELAPKVKRALNGPARPADERANNRDGRNVWFELSLAADWRLRGAVVSLGEPDLRLTKDGLTFLLACKRPDNRNSVKRNLELALAQLNNHLKGTPDNCFGVVALSLNRVLNNGTKISGHMDVVRAHVEQVVVEHEAYLKKEVAGRPKICGAVFHMATPGLGEQGTDMVRASYAAVKALNDPSKAWTIFKQHTVDMYSER